ncbi:MAG: MotA/TolQ/ExbB proton channel family protein [Phycisphaeraceae bacterium]|nr:MAG: MotA/TolQ/ExbB proton channel family protein [Phycisphaeraceae bacterium]
MFDAVLSQDGTLWSLFRQSFDLFTVMLVAGSVVGVALVVRCVIDVRGPRIDPPKARAMIGDLAAGRRWDDLKRFTASDGSMASAIVRAALSRPPGTDRAGLRDAAELAASEESARWFRVIEPLNIIGNLGPLVGLAGTVWGMILAFTTLGESGGQAGPADLSLGISKALFHTLLGLCLAIPCLLIYGLYRGIIDRHCTAAYLFAARVVETLPAGAAREDLPSVIKGAGRGEGSPVTTA